MSDRIPPHNLIAERSLLGEVMSSKHARETSLSLVTSKDFYQESHGVVFDAVCKLHDEGEPVEVATVSDLLQRSMTLEFVGGVPELNRLWNSTQVTDGASHARIVTDHARMRDIIKICTRGALDAYGCPDDVTGLIESLQVAFGELDLPLGKLPDGFGTVEDWMNRPKEDRPQWVIRGLLRDGWRVLIVAVEGFGKTMLLQQFALSAARGVHPFMPDVDTPQITTLLVDCENDGIRLDDGFEVITGRLNHIKPAVPGAAYLWTQPGGINLRARRDRSQLEAVIAACHPQLVCAGPTYKTFEPRPGETHEQPAREVQAVWDNLRTRYKFALVLESHASKGSNGVRSMDPEGSALWLRWSEFGLKMLRDPERNHADEDTYYKVERFRRDRIREHGWPAGLERASIGLPWGARWADSKWQEYIRDDFAEITPLEPDAPAEADPDDPFS